MQLSHYEIFDVCKFLMDRSLSGFIKKIFIYVSKMNEQFLVWNEDE